MLLKALRQELAYPRTSIQLCAMGIIGGICAASLIILFRLSYESIQRLYLTEVGNFTTLSALERFFLPVAGALVLLLISLFIKRKRYRMGIPYVIHRLRYFHGVISLGSTVTQFLGGAVALATGFVVGREGPSVHLGAAGSSFLGRWLKLPNNSIRILAGCGIAAGISASFNTPFAAMLFVMEVVFREYRIHLFVPVMLAAACGSAMTRMVFGHGHELELFEFARLENWMYLYLVVLGMLLGILAAAFNRSLIGVMRIFENVSLWKRLMLAGVLTGTVGLLVPDAMAASFVGVDNLINNDPGFKLIILVLGCKFLLATAALGLGVPGGVIGPTMVIGMLAGVAILAPLEWIRDMAPYNDSFALLGLAGMFCASLHAPIAALSAVMELAFSTEVILPAMLVIVPAYVTSVQLMKNESIFTMQMDFQKLPYTSSSVIEALQKTGVLAVMNRQFKTVTEVSDEHMLKHLDKSPHEPLVQVTQYELGMQFALVQYDVSLDSYADSPLTRYTMHGVHAQATLAEVYDILNVSRDGAVYVYDSTPDSIVGIISWHTLRTNLMREQF